MDVVMVGCCEVMCDAYPPSIPSPQLNLQGLKSLSLDPSILNGPTKGLISHLKSRHIKSVPYYHMKMMIVGGAEKGKTTLLHQLLQVKQPSNPRRNVATLGVNVKQWRCVCVCVGGGYRQGEA